EFMRHKTHAELWRATPYSACPKNNRSEGIVSKRKHSMYRSGRSPDWLLKSGARFTKPVIFPPGRARLRARPMPTGSPDSMTIGIVAVAALAARAAGGGQAPTKARSPRTGSVAGREKET